MKTIKQFGFKLIVVFCIILAFCCFVASTPISYASKVKTDEFYYSGTTKGSYTIEKSFWEKLVDSLGDILDYLLGIITMAFRMVFVGWTELFERALTWIIEGAAGVKINIDSDTETTGTMDNVDYITVESIVFNKIPFFNINIFNQEVSDEYDSLGRELPKDNQGNVIGESDISEDSLITVIKTTIAGWYYAFRLISIMIMLILLIYIGLKLATTSVAKEKAVYKQVLKDWLVGMILVFSIHYVILAMISFNELLVDQIGKMKLGSYKPEAAYEYGLKERAQKGITDSELEISIYDEVRTRAYDAKLTVGTTGMIMYMVLVYYAWKFSFLYLKRYLVVAVLTMMAPFVAVMYAYNKVRTGKTVVFTEWLKELFFMIILQSIHALLYVIFFEAALAISLSSIGGMLFSFVMLHFMTKAEEIFRKIFNVSGKLTDDVAGSKLKDIKKFVSNASLGIGGTKAVVAMAKLGYRAETKPFRLAANLIFGKKMEERAAELDRRNAEERRNNNGMTDYEKAEVERQDRLKVGEIAHNLPDSMKNLSDTGKESIENLRSAIATATGNGKVLNMSKDELENYFYQNKEQFKKDFNKLVSKREVLKHEVKTRWHEIMDPYQYVEKQEDGSYKRKKNKREHENWGPVLKYLSKKKSGTGKTFSKYMNSDYLLGLDKAQKQALKNQLGFIKDEIAGFTGILLGLPLIVAEPALGAAFLAKGISSTNKVFGSGNRARRKNLRNMYMTADGVYHLVGYEGNSIYTITEGMKSTARENYEDYENDEEEFNRGVVRRTKKHRKLYQKIGIGLAKGTGVVGGAGATSLALHTITGLTLPVAVGAVPGVAAGAVLTGHLLGNFGDNVYMAMHDTVRAARRKSQKDWEEEIKSTDSLLNNLANKYFETEEAKKDEYAKSVQSSAQKVENAYRTAVEAETQNIENMNAAQLLRETGYEDEIILTKDIDGKKKLEVKSEKEIIDKAIIETIEKSGLTDIEEYDLNNKARIDQVKKVITDRLAEKGILEKQEKADDIIQSLDAKILNQKAILERERPNAVESKMIDDSVLEVMSQKNITDPSIVQVGDVMERFNEKYKKMAVNTSEESNDVVQNLMKQKKNNSNNRGARRTERTSNSAEAEAKEAQENSRISSAIMARRAAISDKAKDAQSRFDEGTKDNLKEFLRKKKVRELEEKVLFSTNDSETTVNSADTDEIIKKLMRETNSYKSAKEKLEIVSNVPKRGRERVQAYKALVYSTDGYTIDNTPLIEIISRVNRENNL